jgi:hypothetical protein
MFCCSRPLGLLRTLVCLSLIGLAVTVLIGPVLAVLGVLLPFALIGGLAWGGYHAGCMLLRRLRGDRRPVVFKDEAPASTPLPMIDSRVAQGPAPVHPMRRLGALARTGLHLFVEVGCGAALGAGLAVLADWQSSASIERVLLGAGIGAIVAFVVGGSPPRRVPDGTEESLKAASQAA